MRLSNKYYLSTLLVLGSLSSYSQQFEAPLMYSGQSGLYKIELNQQVLDQVGENIGFIRIKDKNQNTAPFILSQGAQENGKIESFKEVSDLTISSLDTLTIVHFRYSGELQSLLLNVANTSVTKSAVLEGSDDNANWYNILPNVVLDNMVSDKYASGQVAIDLPKSNYTYYRLKINDKNSAPIKIKAVRSKEFNKQNSVKPKLAILNAKFNIQQKERQTIITIERNGKTPIAAMAFDIAAPSRFKRKVSLSTVANDVRKTQYIIADQFIDQNNVSVAFDTPLLLDKIQVIIDNDDNAPLEIADCKLYYSPLLLVTELRSGEEYTLWVDTSLQKPVYDLTASEIIDQEIKDAKLGDLNAYQSGSGGKNSNSKYWMYGLIVIGVVVIFNFGYRLLKDMKQNQSQ